VVTISQIKYLKENQKKIDNNEFSIIYLLELGKARKDIPNPTKSYNINNLIKKEIDKNGTMIGERNTTVLSVYGIYDWLTIKKKEPILDISAKFQELLDRTNMEPEQDDLKHFKTKQVLMKVHEGIEGKNKNTQKQFSVIFNIEINKKIDNHDCSNGYNNLNQAIDNLALKLQRNKHFFREAEIYKSLGPKDITVLVRDVNSLESIFKLLEEINQQKNNMANKEGKVLRTFTMLCSNFGEEPAPEKGFSLISYLRISNKFRETDVKELIDKEHMLRITEITGVMDFRIVWKSDVKVSTVLAFYNKMTGNAHLTDFQTKIEKILYYEYDDK